MLSGLSDELIPPAQMNQLFEAIPSSVYRHMHRVPSGTHNDTYMKGGESYFKIIKSFLTAVVESPNFSPPPQALITSD